MQDGIARAAQETGRSLDELTLIVVTKFHPATLVRELHELGVNDVGENRHQEAQEKSREVADLDLNWHYIGQLQTNKARQVFEYANAIHSIDRIRLVNALDKAETDRTIDAFVQVNLSGIEGRGGVDEKDLEPLVERVLESPRLHLRGIMAVASLGADPAAEFARLAKYSERVRALKPEAGDISAGMSHDYAEAIAHGATHLRIGSAITGKRTYAK